ncbi:hypothetical protein JCM8097_000280 [Rhodosporidiobolus ruineniae]
MRFASALYSLGIVGVAARAAAEALSDDKVDFLKKRLALNSTDVWVSGTRIEALLETDYPRLSVLDAPYIPPALPVPAETDDIIASWAAQRIEDCDQFYCVDGGAAGDPASLGVGWILAAQRSASLVPAVDDEVDYLMEKVKRAEDGTMSMRQEDEPLSYWNDFIYMVPPFLAYYGIAYHNETVLDESFKQIELYRNRLQDNSTGLWMHISEGWVTDSGLWTRGNGWAAAGMLRVAATFAKSTYWSRYETHTQQLISWIDEILVAAFSRIRSDILLPNYLDRPADETFSDTASSAILASVSYRLAALGWQQTSTNLAVAEKLRLAVNAGINKTTGWIAPAVNPVSWEENSGESPEGVAFALLLDAAYRAYIAAA